MITYKPNCDTIIEYTFDGGLRITACPPDGDPGSVYLTAAEVEELRRLFEFVQGRP